jgi:hypothetical protein
MAQNEWAESYDWQALYKEYNMLVSTSTGNTSIALPEDFRKLASYPVITYDGSNSEDFPEVRVQENSQYTSTDRRVNILGNPNSGYVMKTYAATLASGASIFVPYYASPRFPLAKAEADKILARLLETENTPGEAYFDRVQTTEERRYSFRIGRD